MTRGFPPSVLGGLSSIHELLHQIPTAPRAKMRIGQGLTLPYKVLNDGLQPAVLSEDAAVLGSHRRTKPLVPEGIIGQKAPIIAIASQLELQPLLPCEGRQVRNILIHLVA